jgi:protein-disulfide isomerase
MKERVTIARLADVATIVVSIAAVWSTYRLATRGNEPGAGEISSTPVSGWEVLRAGRNASKASDSAITMAVFTDFECPACAAGMPILDSALRRFGDRLRIVVYHFPLPGHKYARSAAVASECAGNQGRFFEFHNRLFEQRESIGAKGWVSFAAEAAVADTGTFSRCLESSSISARIDADMVLGRRLGVDATPTVFVNGVKLRGISKRRLIAQIEAALASSGGWRQWFRRLVT